MMMSHNQLTNLSMGGMLETELLLVLFNHYVCRVHVIVEFETKKLAGLSIEPQVNGTRE